MWTHCQPDADTGAVHGSRCAVVRGLPYLRMRTGRWPHQLYVREACRMVGAYVMREADILHNGRRAPIADPVRFGAYDIDMHTYYE